MAFFGNVQDSPGSNFCVLLQNTKISKIHTSPQKNLKMIVHLWKKELKKQRKKEKKTTAEAAIIIIFF
jgi:hypothetical protein